jgi:hypothetical protein
MRVRHPVLAGEAVAREQLGEIEVRFAAVEQGQTALVNKGYVEIEGPRLQGLQPTARRQPVKAQTGFGAEGVEAARGLAVGFGRDAGELVGGVAVVDFGDQIAAELVVLVAQERTQIDPLTFHRVAAREVDVFRAQAGARAQVGVAGERAQLQLRQAAIGFVDGIEPAHHRLVVLDQGRQRIGAGRLVGQPGAAFEMGDGGEIDVPAQVLEILAVADLGVASVDGEAVVDQAEMLTIDIAARAAPQGVAAEEFVSEPPFALRQQIAPLGGDLQTALRHQPGGDRGVVVGAKVEVNRPAQVGAGTVGLAEGREQQPAATAIIDGELEIGQVDDGNPGEMDAGVARRAQPALGVETDLPRLQEPGLGLGRTGGVAHGVEFGAAVGGEPNAVGAAAGGLRHQMKLGGREHPRFRRQIEVGRLAADDQLRVAEDRARPHADAIVLVLKFQRLGTKDLVALAQLHRAGQRGQPAADEVDTVGIQAQRRVVLAERGRFIDQAEVRADTAVGERGRRKAQKDQAGRPGARDRHGVQEGTNEASKYRLQAPQRQRGQPGLPGCRRLCMLPADLSCCCT